MNSREDKIDKVKLYLLRDNILNHGKFITQFDLSKMVENNNYDYDKVYKEVVENNNR